VQAPQLEVQNCHHQDCFGSSPRCENHQRRQDNEHHPGGQPPLGGGLDVGWGGPCAKWGDHVVHGVGYVQHMGFGVTLSE
jgi:hypothetical protein